MTLTTPENDAPIAVLPPLVGVILAALASSLALAWGLAEARGWNSRVEDVSVAVSASLGVLAVAIGAVVGFGLLRSPGARSARLLGMRVLASGSTRLMITLFLGVAILIGAKPEGYTFFTALTLACLTCMLAEAAWAVSALRKAGAVGAAQIKPGATVR